MPVEDPEELTRRYVKNSGKTKKYPDDSIFFYLSQLLRAPNKEFSHKFMKELIDHDASIDYKDKYGDSIFHLICKFQIDNQKVCQIFDAFCENFVERGVDVKEKLEKEINLYGHNILHTIALKSNDNLELFRKVVEGKLGESSPSSFNNNSNNKSRSSKNNNELFYNVSTFGENQTPLHYAARSGNERIVKYLIEEKQVNLEARDHLDRTPLYLAAEYGQTITVKLLKTLGCNVNVSNVYGQKALFWIVSKCSDIASEILDDYVTINRYFRRQAFNLNAVELDLVVDEESKEEKVPDVKSILTYIVETSNLELIVHPVISKLIQVKWNDFGR